MSKKIFVIAGEASGDALGAKLIKSLREQMPGVEITGIGGPLMEKQKFKSLLPMEDLCVMGIWEVLWHLPRLLKLIKAVTEEIEKRECDAVVTIDLPDFNFQVASRLKKRKISKAKIIHYVAPTVWAWRPGRAKKIARFLDGLICLFPFEPPYFEKHKLQAVFAGHPLVESKISQRKSQTFRKDHNIAKETTVLGLFFGSRRAELDVLGPIFKDAVTAMREMYPDICIVAPTLPYLEFDVVQLLHGMDCPVYILSSHEQKYDAMAACDVAIAASGTVGLELAYAGIPHVIGYKVHFLTALMVRLLIRVRYAHLANILLDEMVVPEFLQGKCNALDIAKGALRLMKDENERKAQVEKFKQLSALLGEGDVNTPSERAAAFVIDVMNTVPETPVRQSLSSSEI